jgi:hypothetical protein
MKQFQFGYIVRRFFATAAALALIAVTTLRASRVHAIEASNLNTQTAEILALLSAVHELTSYNGDPAIKATHFAAWKELWAEDATFVINNAVTFDGREAIFTGFFAGAPFFNNSWIGLSPSFRTEVEVHGNTAEVYLECIFLNLNKTVVAERSLHGTIRKIDGNWRFWRMRNDPAQPLF